MKRAVKWPGFLKVGPPNVPIVEAHGRKRERRRPETGRKRKYSRRDTIQQFLADRPTVVCLVVKLAPRHRMIGLA
jgi:hypothetical protein